ncbi:hypothetical protein GCM10007890_04040 [Methylobacterium tardum]|uniref:Uncharacterized protein n=1 Tax=Methylobacterium tardum TaxID=374432 RepID=A0AA37TAJ4_9HYPH|nr:hypothetical protein GCM10007890_04040 [Methylobacterium tardum]
MGWRELSMIRTRVSSEGGQRSCGPKDVVVQSKARTRAPMRPPPWKADVSEATGSAPSPTGPRERRERPRGRTDRAAGGAASTDGTLTVVPEEWGSRRGAIEGVFEVHTSLLAHAVSRVFPADAPDCGLSHQGRTKA